MGRMGTSFSGKNVLRESATNHDDEEGKKLKISTENDEKLSEFFLADRPQIDESVMASPYDDEQPRQKSLLSSQNKEAKNAKKAYVSPVSEEFEEVIDNPIEDKEEELISHNKLVFMGILLAFMYVAFLGVGAHFTTFRDGVPQRITMEDRKEATFLSELDPYATYIQEQHTIIVDASDSYTEGTMAAEELADTMNRTKEALGNKKKELVDLTAPSSYEGMKSKVIELYALQMTFCDDVTAYLKDQSSRNLEATQKANQDFEEKAQSLFEEFDQVK